LAAPGIHIAPNAPENYEKKIICSRGVGTQVAFDGKGGMMPSSFPRLEYDPILLK
jgi:hypothetical protein